MQILVLSSINVKTLTKNNKGLLVDKPVALRPNSEYISLDLILIECKDFYRYMSRIMRYIGDNINVVGMMQVTKLLRLRLRLR